MTSETGLSKNSAQNRYGEGGEWKNPREFLNKAKVIQSLQLTKQSFHASSLFPVTPAINDAGSTRVLMKESSTTLKDIAGAGSSGNLGDC